MFGAEITFTPGHLGSNGAVAHARDLAAADEDLYMPYQYGNQANPDAHYNGTALEILEEIGKPRAFVAGLGTGGTRAARRGGCGTRRVWPSSTRSRCVVARVSRRC